MVQTRRKKAAARLEGSKEEPEDDSMSTTTTPVTRPRRGRPKKDKDTSLVEGQSSTPSTPLSAVSKTPSIEQEDLEVEAAAPAVPVAEPVAEAAVPATPETPVKAEEPVEKLEKVEEFETTELKIEKRQRRELTPEEIVECVERELRKQSTEKNGSQEEFHLKPLVCVSVRKEEVQKTMEIIKKIKEEQKEVNMKVDLSEIRMPEEPKKEEKVKEELISPMTSPMKTKWSQYPPPPEQPLEVEQKVYKRPHIFHPAASAFESMEPLKKPVIKMPTILGSSLSAISAQPPPPPPPPPPPQDVGSEGSDGGSAAPEASSAGIYTPIKIKPIVLKAPFRGGAVVNPLGGTAAAAAAAAADRTTMFGSTADNVPPPKMVEMPTLSFFGTPKFLPKPIPPTIVVEHREEKTLSEEKIRELRQKAEDAAARIAKRVEEQKRLDEQKQREEAKEAEEREEREAREAREEAAKRREEREKEKERRRGGDYHSHYYSSSSSSSRKNEEDERRSTRDREKAREKERDRERKQPKEEIMAKQETAEVKKENNTSEIDKKLGKMNLSPEEMVVPPYEIILECKYFTKNANKKKSESLICDCHLSGHNCSDNSCVNRAMLTECPPSCPTKCKNQRFAKRKYAAVEAYHTGTAKGCGLRALKDIKKGRFIIEYVGEMLERDDYEKRKQKYANDKEHKHHYLCDTGVYTIDATSMGNPSRFINHSCEPNAVCEKWCVPKTPGDVSRIGFFAKRNIYAGEEITFDYQFVNYGRDAQQCYCGAPSCTGWIGEKPEDDSSDDEESDDELVMTRDIEYDEEEKKLEELDMMNEEERREEIDSMLADLILKNRKHAKRVIRIAERMSNHDQKGALIEEIFSQDMSLQTQMFYANEGMSSVMLEWLSQDDFSVGNLRLMQKVLQALHGEVFVSWARSDRDLVDLVSRLAKLDDLPVGAEIQCVVTSLVDCVGSEGEGENYGKHSEVVYNDVIGNFHRLKEMAVRLNHHWFNRSVNFRIPKKVREPEQKDEKSSSTKPDKASIISSPGYSYSSSYDDTKYTAHPRFFNSRSEYTSHYHGYHGSSSSSHNNNTHGGTSSSSRYNSQYKDGYRRKYAAHQYDTSFFNPRKRFRRSRSRSRSPSPYKRRRFDEETNLRYRRSPLVMSDHRKSTTTLHHASSSPAIHHPVDPSDPLMISTTTPSASSTCSGGGRSEKLNQTSAMSSSTIVGPSTSTVSQQSGGKQASQQAAYPTGHAGYDYGMYPQQPYQYQFFQTPSVSTAAGTVYVPPAHPAHYADYYDPRYLEWMNGAAAAAAAAKNPQKDRLALENFPTLDELDVIYDSMSADQLSDRLKFLTDDMHLLHQKLAITRIKEAQEAAAAAAATAATVAATAQAPPPSSVVESTPTPMMMMMEEKDGYMTPEEEQIKEPPPKPDRYTWARAKSDSGETYYYNKITKETQWSPPRAEQGLLDPKDRTPPDTTQESANSSENDEKSRGASSLSARLGEFMETVIGDDSDSHHRAHQEKEEREREAARHRLELAKAKEAEQLKKMEIKSRDFKFQLEKVIAPIVRGCVKNVKDVSQEKTMWLVKLLVKEMFKRESSREGFTFALTDTSEKMVRKYTESLMERKLRNGAIDIWKGYKPL